MTFNEALSLFIVACGGLLAPLLGRLLHVPAAVVEIAFGIAVGAFLPQTVYLSPVVSFLADFGFVLLMFLAGLEIDLRVLARGGLPSFLRVAPFGFFVPLLGVVIAAKLGLPLLDGLLVGCISIGVALPVLQEIQGTQTVWGQTVLIVGGLGELCTIFWLAVLGNMPAQAALTMASVLLVVPKLLELLALFCLAGILFVGLRELLWWFPESLRSWAEAAEDSNELGVRLAIAIMVGFAVIAIVAGIPEILASFLAGLAVAAVLPRRGMLMQKLEAAGYGFFIPIFFIQVGWQVKVGTLITPDALKVLAAVLLGTLLTRFLGAPFLRLCVSGVNLVRSTLLLGAPLTLQVAVAVYAVSQGALPERILPAVVVAASLGAIVYPTIVRRFLLRRTQEQRSEEGLGEPMMTPW